MIKALKIQNIAIIDQLKINFIKGLNILTGETGAGKSIIIDSLNFILGSRADKTLIKTGEVFARVDATFEVDETEEMKNIFNSVGVDFDSVVIISRTLTANGKNECFLNGETVTLATIKKIANQLVDIHGQHDTQILLNRNNHLLLLDTLNSSAIEPLKAQLNNLISDLNNINEQILVLGGNESERANTIDLLSYQLNEIESASLKLNEDAELAELKERLLSAEKIKTAKECFVNNLKNDEVNALSLLGNAINNLKHISHLDSFIVKEIERLKSAYYEIEDITETVNNELNIEDATTERLNEVEDRIDLIKSLKRKYGNTIEKILNEQVNIANKIHLLKNSDKKIEELNELRLKKLNEIFKTCQNLTKIRKNIAKEMQAGIVKHLNDLGMQKASFEVCFSSLYNEHNIASHYTLNGADEIEFMFSANLGMNVKPLSKIISGGELSRVMLAIKCIVKNNTNKTLIFDEIDNGIGGNTGVIVGKKLTQLSKHNQVLCVSHLSQIACMADAQFKIEKIETNKTTNTTVQLLNEAERIKELARMIGSFNGTNYALLHAENLIKEANIFKDNF